MEDIEEIREPQVTSSIPEERKRARRLRIQKRLDTLRKHRISIGTSVTEEVHKSFVEQQVEDSAKQLKTLVFEGSELVTNVRIGNDAREVERRQQQAEARKNRIEALDEEAKKSLEIFEQINSKWSKVLGLNDPLNMHREMEAQRGKCNELINQKNTLIEELRKELEIADIRFRKDQEKQREDIAVLVDRIDNQVNVMRRAYKQELKLIEQAIDIERKQVLDINNKKWELLYSECNQQEIINMEDKFKQVERFEEELREMHIEHQETYRETKIKLETDIQVLQQELEQVKASCLLNSEKLDYNYQVLKERNDENLIMKSQQKRQMNKLQDTVNSLKKTISETDNFTKSETSRLTKEIISLYKKVLQKEKLSDYFSKVNDNKYQQVWNMNKDTANDLFEKILTADKIIHEQQLGLEWSAPDYSLLRKDDLSSFRSVVQLVDDIFQQKNQDETENANETRTRENSAPNIVNINLIKNILRKIADSSGFLLEKHLSNLLFFYKKNEKTLVKLDNVFSALGVTSEEEILKLRDYFLPYAVCPLCASETESYDHMETESSIHAQDRSDSTFSQVSTDTATAAADSFHLQNELAESNADAKFIVSLTNDQADISQSNPKSDDGVGDSYLQREKKLLIDCYSIHPVFIDPVFALTALRKFISDVHKNKETPSNASDEKGKSNRNTVSRLMTDVNVSAFWNKYLDLFPLEKKKLWDCLYIGLKKYLSVLKERHQLNQDIQLLQQQNSELRRLLHGYMMSKGISEKSILPPIRDLNKKNRGISPL